MAAASEPNASQSRPGQLPAGTVIAGQYQIQSPLGRPGACQYYRAVDTGGGGLVTLQVVPMAAVGPSLDVLQADLAQARAFPHKNLVDVFNFGRDGQIFFVATELLDGNSLRQLIDGKRAEGRAITLKAASSIMAHLANMLAHVHQVMPHGGLNPENIWLNRAGRVKVCELGMMRALPALARRGNPTGAPDVLYVAPELMAGHPLSPSTDVYSLGTILYELLTSRPAMPPLAPPSQANPDLPRELDAVIERAIHRNPAGRWPSPVELGEAVMATVAAHAARAAAPRAASQPAQAQPAAPAQVARPATQPVPQMPFPGPAAGSAPVAVPPSVMGPGSGAIAPTPATVPPGSIPSMQLGRSFNVADAASGLGDETQERWLIQKDKLDFGPYSMVQIRAQIERGEIKSQHMIVDMDTGARKQIKDFQALREFTKQAERKLEQLRRAQAEQKHEKVEKSRSRMFVMIIGTAFLVVAAIVGLFIYSRKGAESETFASRVGEADIDAFLKGVKIELAQVKVNRSHGPRRPGSSGGAGDEFNNDMNLGDVSKGGGGDETLDDNVIQNVMVKNYRGLVPCLMAERQHNPGLSTVEIEFVVKGDGHVSAVKVNGQSKTPFAGCVLGRMKTFGFPKFNGNKTIASWSMSMR